MNGGQVASRTVQNAAITTAVLSTAAAVVALAATGTWTPELPSPAVARRWIAQPMSTDFVIALTTAAAVMLWLLLATAVLTHAYAKLARQLRWMPTLHLPGPFQGLTAALLGATAVTTAAGATTHAGSAAAGDALVDTPHGDRPSTSSAATSATRTLRPVGTVTLLINGERIEHTVTGGESLWRIADKHLGEGNRWTEIWELNKGRYWPDISGRTTFTDPDLIFPGWVLTMPSRASAAPDTSATKHPPVASTASPTGGRTTVQSTGPPAAPSTIVDVPDGLPTVTSAAPSTPASPSTAPSASPSVPASSPAASGSASPPADGASPGATSDEHGVHLSPSNWMPWTLAVAISGAATLMWLQRRRRYTGEPDDDPPTELPPQVVQLRQAVARNPELTRPDAEKAEPPTLVPDLAPLPPGGTGVVGDGAPAAARAALVAALASGGPHHPDTRGEVVIDAATLATLLGPDVVTLGAWPRLHVPDSVDDALTVIESRLLHRSRILDEHALTDLDELRQQVPDEEALPPVMLITETPPAGARMRAKVALALGGSLHVSALLLGEWAHGATVEVAPDGHTKLVAGQAAEPVPPRLPVLDPATAIQILTTLREAQTGEPPAIASPAVPITVVPLHASRTETAPAEADTPTPIPAPAAIPAPARAKLRVLGPPRIEDIVAEGRPLRAKALELAVYLAVHPDGAATREIGEYLEPDARISQADQRVHTNASNLRHVLGRTSTAETKHGYVIKSSGRYRLDPATVEVDVWTLRDVMRQATLASGPKRRELLTAACDLYTAPLAESQDYEWLPSHRETVRRWGTEAHLLLADDLLDSNPQAASDLLDKAIGLDRYNEALYVKAMHARYGIGDADGIRTLLRALTKALADLDAEPQETRSLWPRSYAPAWTRNDHRERRIPARRAGNTARAGGRAAAALRRRRTRRARRPAMALRVRLRTTVVAQRHPPHRPLHGVRAAPRRTGLRGRSRRRGGHGRARRVRPYRLGAGRVRLVGGRDDRAVLHRPGRHAPAPPDHRRPDRRTPRPAGVHEQP
jgi:DNA-binding SARP family transcriptional activator